VVEDENSAVHNRGSAEVEGHCVVSVGQTELVADASDDDGRQEGVAGIERPCGIRLALYAVESAFAAQKAIVGCCVNVPSNIESTVTQLPRTPDHAGLVPLRLKRRLHYKRYVWYRYVRTDIILRHPSYQICPNSLAAHK